jgi:hypothetical protein
MYASSFRHDLQTRRFTIRQRPSGWEVLFESDSTILKRAVYQDWHRVERAKAMIKYEEARLRMAGWRETA